MDFNSGSHYIPVSSLKKEKKKSSCLYTKIPKQSNQNIQCMRTKYQCFFKLPVVVYLVFPGGTLTGLLAIRFPGPPWRFCIRNSVCGEDLQSACLTDAPRDSYNGVRETCLSYLAESETPIPSKTAPVDFLTPILVSPFHAFSSNLAWVFPKREGGTLPYFTLHSNESSLLYIALTSGAPLLLLM